jgi:hypothetical protein
MAAGSDANSGVEGTKPSFGGKPELLILGHLNRAIAEAKPNSTEKIEELPWPFRIPFLSPGTSLIGVYVRCISNFVTGLYGEAQFEGLSAGGTIRLWRCRYGGI